MRGGVSSLARSTEAGEILAALERTEKDDRAGCAAEQDSAFYTAKPTLLAGDLSQRTEQQATSIEETVASLPDLVRGTSHKLENAHGSRSAAASARQEAVKSHELAGLVAGRRTASIEGEGAGPQFTRQAAATLISDARSALPVVQMRAVGNGGAAPRALPTTDARADFR